MSLCIYQGMAQCHFHSGHVSVVRLLYLIFSHVSLFRDYNRVGVMLPVVRLYVVLLLVVPSCGVCIT